MLLAPIGGESGWLFALKHIPNDVWREESQINHLLHATLGCLFGSRNLTKCFARRDLFKPVIRLCDVPDQLIVLSRWKVREDEFGLNTALSDLEHAGDAEGFFVQCIWINGEQLAKSGDTTISEAPLSTVSTILSHSGRSATALIAFLAHRPHSELENTSFPTLTKVPESQSSHPWIPAEEPITCAMTALPKGN